MKIIKVTIVGHGHKIEATRTIQRGEGIKFLQQMKRIKDNFIVASFPKQYREKAYKEMPLKITIKELRDEKRKN
jgi:hypothetical protein